MQIRHGDGKTEHGPGVSIYLTGNEVAQAIMSFIYNQGVFIQGPMTVHVNSALCDNGHVYVDPSGSVSTSQHRFKGNDHNDNTLMMIE